MFKSKVARVAFYVGSVVLAYGCGAATSSPDLSHAKGEFKPPIVEQPAHVEQKPDQVYTCLDYMVKVNGKTTVEDSYSDGSVKVIISGDKQTMTTITGAEVGATMIEKRGEIYKYIGPSGTDYVKFGSNLLIRESHFERYAGDELMKSTIIASCYL